MKKRISFFAIFFLLSGVWAEVYAQQVPGSFVYQGQITKSNGVPLEADPVVFKIQIYSATNDCLMYEEQHSINMLNSDGVFSLNVGAGIRSGTDYEDTSSITSVFQNGVNFTGITTCTAGNSYNALTGDTRKVRITYNDGSGSVTLATDFRLQSVPYAWSANSLQGMSANNFVQVNVGQNVTQANLETLLSGTNYNTLLNLISGTPSSPLSMNGQQIKNLSDPTLAQDAATKNYADTKIAGSTVDASGVGTGVGDGKVLAWNATLNRWEAITPSSITDSTKLPLAGGTMAGNINMNGNQILNTGHITMQTLSTITMGKYDSTQETTLVSSLTGANKGAVWFNSTTNKPMFWDGSAAVEIGNNGADITAVNTTPPLSGGASSGAITLSIGYDDVTIGLNGSNQFIVKSGSIGDTHITGVSITKLTTGPGEYFGYMPAGTECANNQVLKWDATLDRWLCANDDDTNTDAVSSVHGRTGAVVALSGDYTGSQVTNTAAGNIAATNVQSALDELDTEKVAKSGDTMTGALNLPSNGLVVGATELVVSGSKVGIGSGTPATKLDVAGTIKIADGGETCSIAANAGMIRYNTGNLQYCNGSSWQTLGISGAGLTSLNGETGSTQTFATGSTGIAPAFSSATNTHTLNIPLASGVGVTSGTISKADYDAFTAKLSAVAGSTLNSGMLWVGNGSNQATAVTMSGDATLDNAGALTIANNAITTAKINANAVTSAKILDGTITTADLADDAVATVKILDSNVTTSKIADGNVTTLKLADDAVTSAKILDGTIATADIANSAVTDAKINTVSVNKITSALGQYLMYAPNGAACASGEVLKWNTLTGWECGTDSGGVTAHNALTGLGADDHTQYALLAGRAGGQTLYGGTAASNNITMESTSHATKGYVNLQPNGGNVGIGTTSPAVPLHLNVSSGTNTLRLQ